MTNLATWESTGLWPESRDNSGPPSFNRLSQDTWQIVISVKEVKNYQENLQDYSNPFQPLLDLGKISPWISSQTYLSLAPRILAS